MDNLSYYQERILDKILPPISEKRTPSDELVRLCKVYDRILRKETDEYLLNSFNRSIERSLCHVLNQDFRFQELSEYKKEYFLTSKEYIEDHIDDSSWDGIDYNRELTKDYLEDCILYQNKILDHTLEFLISIEWGQSIDVIQFVSKEFLDEYRHSSRRKIEFLNLELNKLKGGSKPSEEIKEIEYDNPYTEYFKSYGYQIYKDFTADFEKDEIVLAPLSFLVDQLRKDGLMNNDKTLKSVFDFMIEELDANFGTALKFKSDYSSKKHLQLYKQIKKRYDTVS